MLALCGLKWWKKPEYPQETIDLGQATATLSQYLESNLDHTGDKQVFNPCSL